jgi:hypothetical protein
MTVYPPTGTEGSVVSYRSRYENWIGGDWHTHLTIDLVPGRGAGFSLEAPTGNRFLIRSRLFSDAEYAGLGESPASQVGVQPGGDGRPPP